MGINPLDPASAAGRPDRDISRGHGTHALGPSDSSDSGSDLAGSESDRSDTYERSPAERDAREGADIDADHIEQIPEGLDDEDVEDE
jgi:hypothetical protein